MVLRVEGVGLMRKKLNSESGLTLVEMLCAVAILVLLVLLLSTGMQMALRTYRDIVAQSEVRGRLRQRGAGDGRCGGGEPKRRGGPDPAEL